MNHLRAAWFPSLRMKPNSLRQSPFQLRIVDRYLLREVAFGIAAALAVLLLIMVGGAFTEMLGKVARGRVPAELLFILVSLQTINTLPILVPLAVLMGILLGYGRLWRDSEMAVLQSSGLGVSDRLWPLLWLVLPLMVALALVAFWLGPAAERKAQDLLTQASRSLLVAGLEAGRFVELPGREGTIYVGEMSADGAQFKRLFIESERPDADTGKTRIDVITASSGFLYHDADGAGRYIALEDGFRVEGKLGEDDFRLMRFKRNDIRLPDAPVEDDEAADKRHAPSTRLWQTPDDPVMRAELHWRLAAPLSLLVLSLLALPLSRSSPREPRYARILLALLAWFIYYNLLLLGRTWIGAGRLAPGLGLWWAHALFLVVALWLIWSSQRFRVPATKVAQ